MIGVTSKISESNETPSLQAALIALRSIGSPPFRRNNNWKVADNDPSNRRGRAEGGNEHECAQLNAVHFLSSIGFSFRLSSTCGLLAPSLLTCLHQFVQIRRRPYLNRSESILKAGKL